MANVANPESEGSLREACEGLRELSASIREFPNLLAEKTALARTTGEISAALGLIAGLLIGTFLAKRKT